MRVATLVYIGILENQLLLRDGEVIVPSNQLRRVSMLLKKGSILAGLNSGPYERQSSFPGPFKRCSICNLDVIGCKFYLAEYSSKANSEQNSEWYTIHRNVETHPYFAAWNIHISQWYKRTKFVLLHYWWGPRGVRGVKKYEHRNWSPLWRAKIQPKLMKLWNSVKIKQKLSKAGVAQN